MSRRSLVLLSAAPNEMSFAGDPVRADGWYGHVDHLHTIAIHTSNFRGELHIEASIAEAPEEGDWFPAIEPILYPRPEYTMPLDQVGETSVIGVNFRGNYVWIRARVERPESVFPAPEAEMGQTAETLYGRIDRILLNQ